MRSSLFKYGEVNTTCLLTGDLLNQFEELDMKLSLQLLEACRPYLTKDKVAKPLAQYHNFLLNSEDVAKLEALFGKVKICHLSSLRRKYISYLFHNFQFMDKANMR